jgi:hypothetical protein
MLSVLVGVLVGGFVMFRWRSEVETYASRLVGEFKAKGMRTRRDAETQEPGGRIVAGAHSEGRD